MVISVVESHYFSSLDWKVKLFSFLDDFSFYKGSLFLLEIDWTTRKKLAGCKIKALTLQCLLLLGEFVSSTLHFLWFVFFSSFLNPGPEIHCSAMSLLVSCNPTLIVREIDPATHADFKPICKSYIILNLNSTLLLNPLLRSFSFMTIELPVAMGYFFPTISLKFEFTVDTYQIVYASSLEYKSINFPPYLSSLFQSFMPLEYSSPRP